MSWDDTVFEGYRSGQESAKASEAAAYLFQIVAMEQYATAGKENLKDYYKELSAQSDWIARVCAICTGCDKGYWK